MTQRIRLLICLLLLSAGICSAGTYPKEYKQVNNFAPSSNGNLDIDLAFQFGVDFESELHYYSSGSLTLNGTPIVSGLSMELSYSQYQKVLPVAVGFDVNFSHSTYSNRDEYGIIKGAVVDRIPLRAYIRSNTIFYAGVGVYDNILVRGSVAKAPNLYLSMIDDRCFTNHLYGIMVILGIHAGRFDLSMHINVGLQGQLNLYRIAELNRTYVTGANEITTGIYLRYSLATNYSPTRNVKPTFRF